MSSMDPLRDEHAELIPHIAELAATGDAVGTAPVSELRELVEASHRFLSDHLIPHAEDEERSLYPVVQRVIGAPEATATMTRDHVEVGRLTEELVGFQQQLATADELPEDLANGLRRVLYGLHHLVKVHFAKEEEVYLPILEERLDDDAAAAMFEDMHGGGDHGHHDHG